MDNNQRLEFILRLERKEKRKRIVIGVIVVLLIGAGIVFLQIKGMSVPAK